MFSAKVHFSLPDEFPELVLLLSALGFLYDKFISCC